MKTILKIFNIFIACLIVVILISLYSFFMLKKEYKNVNIVFINYSMEDLTPEFIINNKIYTIIMYHGLEWLNKQVGLLNIVKNPLLNRELIVPALVDNLAIDKANKKLFEELSKRMGTILTLQFVDARYFSPERLEK